jgi:hypothetical protein
MAVTVSVKGAPAVTVEAEVLSLSEAGGPAATVMLVLSWPILFAFGSVNQRLPSGPVTMP